ncbi:MAG TPA: NAD(P)/FAD-dependent oxidoreductase [Candidatus Angelobacter sp.]|nr:NAD(P)/FAD-dependent oxidoreductase [Candidatus Angelobacter sp.]
MQKCDVAIIGAGPYGLSAAAHLRAANGLDVRVFGEPMSFWERHMPNGMLLRSPLAGSHLSDPSRLFTLQAYEAASGNRITSPLPLHRFTDYGRWFQSQAVPDLDLRKVDRVEKNGEGFHLGLEDGDTWKARRVVIAAGIMPFAWHPPEFRNLPFALASHACAHRDLSRFAGKKVAVIGAGQSALESAALLHELGAEVEVLARAPFIRWLWRQKWFHTFKPVARLLYAPPDVGQAGLSHLVARPNLFRRMPRPWQNRLGKRAIRPAGAGWLNPRCAPVRIQNGTAVLSASAHGNQVELRLSDATDRRVDHVLLATGYRVDIARYPFLAGGILDSIRRIDGYPLLDSGFQSSIPGLHFLGAPAAWSFGPLMRFVAGAEFASRTVTRGILGTMNPNGSS